MEIRFRCGHGFEVDPDKVTMPVCLQCGDRHIVRVSGDAPRITGHGSGPLVRSAYLEAKAVPLASVPLRLKTEEGR